MKECIFPFLGLRSKTTAVFSIEIDLKSFIIDFFLYKDGSCPSSKHGSKSIAHLSYV